MNQDTARMKAVLLVAATFAFVVSPFITRNFAGYDPDLFPVRIEEPSVQPAGYAFSIWTLIYVWLVVHALFGLLKRAEDPSWDRVRWPLILSLAFGATWLGVAAFAPVWATIVIWVMLAGAIVALLRAETAPDRWLLLAPLAIYAGWLTAASCASLGIVLGGYGVLTDTLAAGAMLVLLLLIAGGVQTALGRAPEYGATVIWALVAIIVRNVGTNDTVAILAAVGVLVMAAFTVRVFRRHPAPV